MAGDDSVVKVGVRDLAVVAARAGHGATTVASTAHLAASAGIHVFATGGLGGVHRGAAQTYDESAEQVAEVMRQRAGLGTDRTGLVVANPVPADEQLDPRLHDEVLAAALAGAESDGVHGKATTPYLLARFHHDTQGRSLEVNTRIILRNAALAGQIAVAYAGRS